MNPHRRNKIDIGGLQESQLLAKYGKLRGSKLVLQKDRKYFDSGDYALSKAGRAPREAVGTAIPNPDSIPHASPTPASNHSSPHISVQVSPVNSPTSPAKESSLSHESTLADIMSTDPTTSDTTVETEQTVVEVAVELTDPANLPTRNVQEIESGATDPGSRGSDVKMD